MNDNDILKIFIRSGRIDSNKIRKIQNSDEYKEIKEYLDNRFSDYSGSYAEIINRIRFNIEVAPVCKCCGAPVQWISKNKYRDFCSCSCKNKYMFNEIKEKSIVNHGSAFNRNKFKDTILKKFGKENWCNREKFKETFSRKSKEEIDEITEKKKNTNLERYGDENFNNRELSRYTTTLHYGVDNYFKTQECKTKSKLSYYKNKNEIDERIKTTKLHKYNSYNNYYKAKHTKLIKYGDENYNNRIKAKQTCIDKYGVENIFNLEYYKKKSHSIESINKIKQTSLCKYGTEFPIQSPAIQSKIVETKRKNNTFNTSKPEEQTFDILKQKYPDVIRQYRSELYPFSCDFYIPSMDLYVECNYHWTHGGHPFNEKDIHDQEKLKLWQSKNTKFYNNAINTWTVRDVKKRKIAKQNNLNFIELWNINQLNNIL